jgi:hypothetical protein
MILFVALMGLTPALAQMWRIAGLALLPFCLPALAALVWMGREVVAYSRRKGCATPAMMAYSRRVVPLSAAYVIVLMLAITAHDRFHISGPALYAIAVLPALPLIGVVWALGRLLIEETDEYQRGLAVRKMLVATGVLLVAATVWGFLEDFGLVPHLPAYWAFIVWCIGLGIGALFNKARP